MDQQGTITIDELYDRAEQIVSDYCDLATDIQDSFAGKGDKGPEYYVSAAVDHEYRLAFIVNELIKRGEDVCNYIRHLENIARKNRSIFYEYDSDFSVLLGVLDDCMNEYAKIVCYIFELDPINLESDNDLLRRDEIEMLLDFIPEEKIKQTTIAKVNILDKSLKHKFELRWEECLNSSDYISEPHYPDQYWWRHPEEQLSEYIEYYKK